MVFSCEKFLDTIVYDRKHRHLKGHGLQLPRYPPLLKIQIDKRSHVILHKLLVNIYVQNHANCLISIFSTFLRLFEWIEDWKSYNPTLIFACLYAVRLLNCVKI